MRWEWVAVVREVRDVRGVCDVRGFVAFMPSCLRDCVRNVKFFVTFVAFLTCVVVMFATFASSCLRVLVVV